MAISRPPKDTAIKNRSFVGTRSEYTNGTPGFTTSGSYQYERDERPSYPYGAKSTLPGGSNWISPTAYSHTSWTMSPPGVTAAANYRDSSNRRVSVLDTGRDASVIIGAWSNVLSSIPQDARNEAVTKALNSIADQKINVGENLGTFNQTLGMFTGRAAKLNALLHSGLKNKSLRPYLRRTGRSVRRNQSTLNNAAGLYLEYVYGLKPLMDDVYTGYKLLQDEAVKSLLLIGEGSASRTQAGKPNQKLTTSYAYCERLSATSTVKVKCKLHARIDPNHKGLRALNQFGLLNPLGLAWDLVPYSFVLDWFIPIGPVLYALSAPAGLIFVGGSTAGRRTEVHTFKYSCFGPTAKLDQDSPAFPVVTLEGYERVPHSSWPLPGIWASPNPFSGDRPLKALALSIASLSGKIPIR